MRYIVLTFFTTLALFALEADPKLEKSLESSVKTTKEAAKSQAKIDTLHTKEQEMFSEYKAVLQEIETLKTYNKQLQDLVDAQEAEKKSINEQIVEVDITAQGIMPLMQTMIEALKNFTKLDTPFLQEEREKRIAKLSTLLSQPKLTVSQKYRSIMEAYAIELEYGNTLETYVANKGETKVNFLKVGRIGLYYLTLNEEEAGIYNPIKREFVALDTSYIRPIKKAMKIAKKQQAPNLLELPLFISQQSLQGAK